MSLKYSQLFSKSFRNVIYISTKTLKSKNHNRRPSAKLIFPPRVTQTLAQRLAEVNVPDPTVNAQVDIGFPSSVSFYKPEQKTFAKKENFSNEQLLEAALSKTLKVDLQAVKDVWQYSGHLEELKEVAEHYGIFHDLFKYGYFTPRIPLHITYDYNEDEVNPVHRGNILTASETTDKPHVFYKCDQNDLWTLVLTNLDGHFNDNNAEYIHWFIYNIKGNDISTGEELIPYLQPFPARGTGYHRMVFILYKQDAGLMTYKTPKALTHRFKLKDRTFFTFDFYKEHQDSITPAGLAFFQSVWDNSLVDFYNNSLGMRVPVFNYIQKPKYVPPQVKYPVGHPFNIYLNKYRDRQEIRKEVLLKRLNLIHPFKEEQPVKFPNLHIQEKPSWAVADRWKENNRIGRFKDLRPFSIYEQPEFNFQRDMFDKRPFDATGKDVKE